MLFLLGTERLSTWTETRRVFDREILPHLRGRRLSEITKADVRKLIEGVAKRAPVGANRMLETIKTFFAFAVEQDLISVSPAASVRPPAVETARERAFGRLAGLARGWRVRRDMPVADPDRSEAK